MKQKPKVSLRFKFLTVSTVMLTVFLFAAAAVDKNPTLRNEGVMWLLFNAAVILPRLIKKYRN